MQNNNEGNLTFQFWQAVKGDDLVTLTNKISKKYEATTSSYEASIGALLNAIQGDFEGTTNFINLIEQNFNEKTPSDTKAWLYGRILAAFLFLEELHECSHNRSLMDIVAKQIDDLIGKTHSLSKTWTCKIDTLTSAWAIGYLITYNVKVNNIKLVKEQLGDLKNLINSYMGIPNTDKDFQSSLLWAATMYMFAAAKAEEAGIRFNADENHYAQAKAYLLKATFTETILEALRSIPKEDFHAWALNLVRLSAYLVGDQEVSNSLEKAVDDSIKNAPNDVNKALGMAYKAYTDEVILQQEALNALQFA